MNNCINCYKNCRTCNGERNSDNMSCLSCNTNYIKYNQNCYLINDTNLRTFFDDPDDNTTITNCYEKYRLYIKKNSYECIPFPENGYYISNNETGLLSECYESCLNCISRISTNENKLVISMGCTKCKDNKNNIYVESEKQGEGNCFPILEYSEKSIYFNIGKLEIGKEKGSCFDFNKSIIYGEYECKIKPDDYYYVIQEDEKNTGVIKQCNIACSSCYGLEKEENTNCINCSIGYYKTEDSYTNCILKEKIPYNYYLNEIDNIYYKCNYSCYNCTGGYDINTDNMNCINCIEGSYFINGTNNCYDISLLNEGYYLKDNETFYPCYKSCSKCDGPFEIDLETSLENHNCIECAENYTKLQNNSFPYNCYFILENTLITQETSEIYSKSTDIFEDTKNNDTSENLEKTDNLEESYDKEEKEFTEEIEINDINEEYSNNKEYEKIYEEKNYEIIYDIEESYGVKENGNFEYEEIEENGNFEYEEIEENDNF